MTISITQPDWLVEHLDSFSPDDSWNSAEERMKMVINLARETIKQETGGPFAAGIFERDSGRLVTAAVNRVIPSHTSIAHAETLALALAQQKLGTHDLSAEGLPAMELVASAQPCIQCFGNTWWSGVQSLLIGSSADDVESILGFHEGPLPDNWEALLADRPSPLPSVRVVRGVLQENARAALSLYKESSGMVYNAGGK